MFFYRLFHCAALCNNRRWWFRAALLYISYWRGAKSLPARAPSVYCITRENNFSIIDRLHCLGKESGTYIWGIKLCALGPQSANWKNAKWCRLNFPEHCLRLINQLIMMVKMFPHGSEEAETFAYAHQLQIKQAVVMSTSVGKGCLTAWYWLVSGCCDIGEDGEVASYSS